MINAIIEAISLALYREFGESYEIHMEEIKQGLKEPCFFIFLIEQSNKRYLGMRYFKENAFVIQYFPKSMEIQRECNETAERMRQCLEFIEILGEERPVQGSKMKYEVVDGVLNFFVNYNYFVRNYENIETIQEMHNKVEAKEG